jgi:hypothetical protein
MRFHSFLAALTAIAASHASAQEVWLTYEASDGTLPSDQCWDLIRSGGPVPTLENGAVNIGPSSTGGYIYYTREMSIDFAQGAAIEAEVFIDYSDYGSNPCGAGPRAGFYLTMFDVSGRLMYLGVGSNVVYLTADASRSHGPGSPIASVPMAGRWRTIRVEIESGVMTAFIDGVQTLTTAVNGPLFSTTRRASFGDESVCAGSHSRVRSVRVLAREECRVDFNRDRFVDFFDYDAYVSCFEGGECPCDQTPDFNGDGFADFFDYDEFVASFESGC